jgi:hypothetical protein
MLSGGAIDGSCAATAAAEKNHIAAMIINFLGDADAMFMDFSCR